MPADGMIRGKLSTALIVAVMLIVSAVAVWVVTSRNNQIHGQLKEQFIREAAAATSRDSFRLNNGIKSIYENLRTLASLPSVGNIDRHATNLSDEARATFQHIYNNLADSVAVSEVYVLPIDFNPDRIDTVTGRPEEPIIMFDHLVLNARAQLSHDDRQLNPDAAGASENDGPPEVEIHEYRLLASQAMWFKGHYRNRNSFKGLAYPIIAGASVITCDNTHFIQSRNDADRTGTIFSVPFFAPDGSLKGMISAIILDRNVSMLLPSSTSALVNTGYGYYNAGTGLPQLEGATRYARAGLPDPSLLYSQVMDLDVVDARSPFKLWASLPNSAFTESNDVLEAKKAYILQLFGILGLTMLGGAAILLLKRNLEQSRALNKALEVESQLALAQQAEVEARKHAEQMDAKSREISKLNLELGESLHALKAAQEDNLRKGKMAQLGSLIATIAHEVRNPLGSIRTSAFMLQRKFSNQDAEAAKHLGRIELGIARCDNIITQLLDFARTSQPNTKEVAVDEWLVATMQELAKTLPNAVSIECDLGSGETISRFDPDHLQRALASLLRNAAEALINAKTGSPAILGRTPKIRVISRSSTDGIEIEIADNGPGILPDNLARVREPLFTTKSFGAGLGIPAAQQVVESHGGKLEIQSSPGEGASFRLKLPLTAKGNRVH